jgi:hypothetical protein
MPYPIDRFQIPALLILGMTLSTTPSLASNSETDTTLDGLWLQSCSSAFARLERFSSSHAELIETSFTDRFCTSPQLSIISSGSIHLGGTAILPEGASKIDFIFEKVEITVQSPRTLAFFNDKHLCGFTDWQLNAPKEVTGLSCDFFDNNQPFMIPVKGEKRYGIYQLKTDSRPSSTKSSQSNTNDSIHEDQLYFGKLTPEENAKTESTRPTTLDSRFYVRTSLHSKPTSHSQAF